MASLNDTTLSYAVKVRMYADETVESLMAKRGRLKLHMETAKARQDAAESEAEKNRAELRALKAEDRKYASQLAEVVGLPKPILLH